MNRIGLIFNIFISLIVIFGSCSRNKLTSYTGLYQGNIIITYYNGDDSKSLDTSIKTIVIVNKSFNTPNELNIQWYFDNSILLPGKSLEIPSILDVEYEKLFFDEEGQVKIFNFRQHDEQNFIEGDGYLTGETVVLNLQLPKAKVVIKACKEQ